MTVTNQTIPLTALIHMVRETPSIPAGACLVGAGALGAVLGNAGGPTAAAKGGMLGCVYGIVGSGIVKAQYDNTPEGTYDATLQKIVDVKNGIFENPSTIKRVLLSCVTGGAEGAQLGAQGGPIGAAIGGLVGCAASAAAVEALVRNAPQMREAFSQKIAGVKNAMIEKPRTFMSALGTCAGGAITGVRLGAGEIPPGTISSGVFGCGLGIAANSVVKEVNDRLPESISDAVRQTIIDCVIGTTIGVYIHANGARELGNRLSALGCLCGVFARKIETWIKETDNYTAQGNLTPDQNP